jgi:hypothetical protein
MSLNAIVFRNNGQEFGFDFDGCWGNSPTAVGKAIVNALLEGREESEFPYRNSVTVQYLVEMLRYTGRTGEFYDDLEGGDHDFDGNTPTPGAYWAEVRDLRARARAAAFQARDIRDSEVAGHLAESFAAIAAEFDEAANQHDRSKLGLRPLRGTLTMPKAKCWNSKIGTDAIWWDPQARVFKFGGYFTSPSLLGRMIAIALLRGEEWVTVGEFRLTVSYLVQMCREVGKHGEFVDFTDDDFDPNVAPDMGADR